MPQMNNSKRNFHNPLVHKHTTLTLLFILTISCVLYQIKSILFSSIIKYVVVNNIIQERILFSCQHQIIELHTVDLIRTFYSGLTLLYVYVWVYVCLYAPQSKCANDLSEFKYITTKLPKQPNILTNLEMRSTHAIRWWCSKAKSKTVTKHKRIIK